MGNQKFTAEFREEAVRQVLDRGYSVKEVSENLGVSTHSLYKWLKGLRPFVVRQVAADPQPLAHSAVITVLAFVGGGWLFRRTEPILADRM
jgi:transposase-like protein